jgi:hypothetical protein
VEEQKEVVHQILPQQVVVVAQVDQVQHLVQQLRLRVLLIQVVELEETQIMTLLEKQVVKEL